MYKEIIKQISIGEIFKEIIIEIIKEIWEEKKILNLMIKDGILTKFNNLYLGKKNNLKIIKIIINGKELIKDNIMKKIKIRL